MTITLVATVGQKFTVTRHDLRALPEMAVTAELSRRSRASPHVEVDLVTGTVITESVETLPLDVVAAAVDDAGYELAR